VCSVDHFFRQFEYLQRQSFLLGSPACSVCFSRNSPRHLGSPIFHCWSGGSLAVFGSSSHRIDSHPRHDFFVGPLAVVALNAGFSWRQFESRLGHDIFVVVAGPILSPAVSAVDPSIPPFPSSFPWVTLLQLIEVPIPFFSVAIVVVASAPPEIQSCFCCFSLSYESCFSLYPLSSPS
jgi:hypothetical protein